MGLRRPVRLIAFALLLASGFAGLGYQIVWTQQSALWLGHEAAAVLAVVTAFFGGLAAGAFACGPRIEKSRHPRRWYAACELLIALWSLALIAVLRPASAWLLGITGAQPHPAWQWLVALCGTFLLLLPATAAMGATLPAMERLAAELRRGGRSIAALYACNTAGAVLGVLATAFWLIPALGLARTTALCAALNASCAIAAVVLFPRTVEPLALLPRDSQVAWPLLLRLACTGLLGIGYEVLVVRVLSQVAEDTTYTFAMLLAVYLVGSAAGAAAWRRWFEERARDPRQASHWLCCALALACIAGTASLWAAPQVKSIALHVFGASMPAAVAAEAAMAVVAFGLPTLVMGALFSHLAARASVAGVSFGRVLGVNTLGAAAAPVVFGVIAFPLLGPKLALLLVGLGYLVLDWRAWRLPTLWMPAGAALALALWAPRLAFIDVPDGGHIVSYREGVMAAVSVVEDAQGVARLRIDNRQQEGSSATLRVDARQGLLPLYLHPAPRRALFLGLGTGITSSAAAEDPELEVDAVELLPEVIATSAHFTRAFTGDAQNPRLHLIAADARRYVRTSRQRYDVIVSDNFHPARSGSGSLYTVEHFAAVRRRLTPGGVFCQWLPLHQLDLGTLRSIVQSFLTVYPHGWALLASNSLETPVIGLVATSDPAVRLDVAALGAHLAEQRFAQQLAGIGIEDEVALLGGFIAGPAALRHFAGDAPANTDDRPIVAYRAPRMTYAPDSLPRDRLIGLLAALYIDPGELIAPTAAGDWPRRLAAYWQARDRFIETGRNIIPSADVRQMLAQVREPLLSALRISPDFRPAYDPLLRMASALAEIDTAAAHGLLTQLEQLQPSRPEARLALASLH